MQTVQKEKVYGYVFKAVLSLILIFCLYNAACIFFLSSFNIRKLQDRIYSTLNTVTVNLKNAGPKKTEKILYKPHAGNKSHDSSWAKKIERTLVFAGQAEARVGKTEKEVVLAEKDEVTPDTEIIFQGLVDDLAYINIRKEIDGQWCEHGFAIKAGERIGGKKIVGEKMLDFTTDCVLRDIACNVQRPTTLMRKAVLLNEAGEFAGTKIVPGETFMKSTSKIIYQDEVGNIHELWLNESEKMLKTEVREIADRNTLSENVAGRPGAAALENKLTKQ